MAKWPGAVYVPLCFCSRSPTDFFLGLLHFPPASLLGYGWLQLLMNNHSRGIGCIPFVWGRRNKTVIWKCSFLCMLHCVSYYILLGHVHLRKDCSLGKLSSLNFLCELKLCHFECCDGIFCLISVYCMINLLSIWQFTVKVLFFSLDLFDSILLSIRVEEHWPFSGDLLKTRAATILSGTLFRQK